MHYLFHSNLYDYIVQWGWMSISEIEHEISFLKKEILWNEYWVKKYISNKPSNVFVYIEKLTLAVVHLNSYVTKS
jgi:hypothetical protein